ncbi:unnamed protein product [Cylicocyclus nassatus]|uniref:Uncharacterized protein n=1 Tax=Cylicocyclus nassatus TaxID=53992 RepID=A0AA36MCH8_CYLNA|nr:unnamed protein product [Cylicocyclus nassatus]
MQPHTLILLAAVTAAVSADYALKLQRPRHHRYHDPNSPMFPIPHGPRHHKHHGPDPSIFPKPHGPEHHRHFGPPPFGPRGPHHPERPGPWLPVPGTLRPSPELDKRPHLPRETVWTASPGDITTYSTTPPKDEEDEETTEIVEEVTTDYSGTPLPDEESTTMIEEGDNTTMAEEGDEIVITTTAGQEEHTNSETEQDEHTVTNKKGNARKKWSALSVDVIEYAAFSGISFWSTGTGGVQGTKL